VSKGEKLKKDQSPSSHSSGQHRLNLEAEMSRSTPTEVAQAHNRYEEEKMSSEPPPDQPRMQSSPDVREMGDAARQLGESVDKVCEALVMVFGKISQVSDESHGQTLVLRSLMKLMVVVAIIQGVVAAVMIFLAFNTITTAKAVEVTHRHQEQATKDLAALTTRVEDIAKTSKETSVAVAEVKKEADEKPTVELAPDPKKPGGAVVRIVPPKTVPPKSDSSAAPPKKPAPPKSTGIEIPIKVEEARPPVQDAEPGR
jgi:hypothetical protein